jgi:hypothetical protein
MSVEFCAVRVPGALFERFHQAPELRILWDIGCGWFRPPSRDALAAYCRERYGDALGASAACMVQAREVPTSRFQVGSEWQRLEQLFAREPDRIKRAVLRSVFHGTREPIYEVAASYGNVASIRGPALASALAALRNVDMATLCRLAAQTLVTPQDFDLVLVANLVDLYADAAEAGAVLLVASV